MSDDGDLYTLGLNNHLLVSRSLAVRGTVHPINGRLADHLRRQVGPTLLVRGAEIEGLPDGTLERFDAIHVARHGLLFAHEYVDTSSDPHLRQAFSGEETLPILVWAEGFSLSGRTSRRALRETGGFLPITEPAFVTVEAPFGAHVARVKGLPWILLNRDGILALVEDEVASRSPSP